jgi:hypothetical protein
MVEDPKPAPPKTEPETWGEQWERRVKKHPLVIAATLFFAGVGVGIGADEFFRPRSGGNAAAQSPCRVHEFRIAANKMNTGDGVTYTCSGTTFTVTAASGRYPDGHQGRRVTVRAQAEMGGSQSCDLDCSEGQNSEMLGQGCPMLSSIFLNCARPDEVTLRAALVSL